MDIADKVWEQNNWGDDEQSLLNEHNQTTYKRKKS
jgi:hypothetical protein